jgi:hypothetical protein
VAPRRVIVTAAGPNLWRLFAPYALPTFEWLADALGIGLKVTKIESDGRDYLSDAARSARWAKLNVIEQAFDDGYDEVLWLDADIVVMRCDDNPFRYLVRPDDIQAFVYEHNAVEARLNPNVGVWVARRSEMMRELLAEARAIGELPESTWSDQGAIIQALGWNVGTGNHDGARPGRGSRYLDRTAVLPAAWNQLWIDIAFPEERNCPIVPRPIAVHFAGLPYDARATGMQYFHALWRRRTRTVPR